MSGGKKADTAKPTTGADLNVTIEPPPVEAAPAAPEVGESAQRRARPVFIPIRF
jgi:hypothetical protein